jgi:hypothetical protein
MLSALRVPVSLLAQNSNRDQPPNFLWGTVTGGSASIAELQGLNSVLNTSRFRLIPAIMSLNKFNIETLVFPGVFPRGHPRCTQKPTDRLEVVVNKYSPRSNPNPKTGDVSLVLLHANGFHKVSLS